MIKVICISSQIIILDSTEGILMLCYNIIDQREHSKLDLLKFCNFQICHLEPTRCSSRGILRKINTQLLSETIHVT